MLIYQYYDDYFFYSKIRQNRNLRVLIRNVNGLDGQYFCCYIAKFLWIIRNLKPQILFSVYGY